MSNLSQVMPLEHCRECPWTFPQWNMENWKIMKFHCNGDMVGGLEHEFYFSIQLGIIIPTDFHIFQRDWNHQPVIYYNDVGNKGDLSISPSIHDPFLDEILSLGVSSTFWDLEGWYWHGIGIAVWWFIGIQEMRNEAAALSLLSLGQGQDTRIHQDPPGSDATRNSSGNALGGPQKVTGWWFHQTDWFKGKSTPETRVIFPFHIWGFPVPIFPTQPIHWFKHECYFPFHIWDVNGCHPKPIFSNSIIFQDGHIAPPTRWSFADTKTRQIPGVFDESSICAMVKAWDTLW